MIKKFVEFAVGNGIVLLIGLLSSPIITRIVDPNEMGKFSFFNTISNLLLLLVLLGMDQSYIRYYHNEDDEDRVRLLIKCMIIPLIITLIAGIAITIMYKQISLYIVGEVSFKLILLVNIHLIASVFSRFILLEVRMRQRAKLYSLLNVFMKLGYLILIVVLFNKYKNNYMLLVLATILSNILMVILAIIFEKKQFIICNVLKPIKTKSKDMVNYGVPFIFSMAIIWIFQSIDRIAIKQFCGYSEVGLYSGAMNIISLLNACQAAFTTFWTPVAYEHYSNNPNNKEFFTKINKVVSVVMLIIAILIIGAKDLIILLLGEKYREAVFIFPYLVFMPIMYTISETTVLGINFKEKTKNHIYIAIISAIVNIVGNLILVPKYGAIGAAISTGISYIVFFSVRTILSLKYYSVNYNLRKFYISVLVTYILATYSSFNKFNLGGAILTLFAVGTVVLLYRDVIYELYNLIKDKIFKTSIQ